MQDIDHWEKYKKIWHIVKVPLRPSQEFCDIYSFLMFEYKKRLLIGNTIELSSLDFDKICIEKFTCENTDRTTFVNSSWLNLPFKENSFDAVYGDGFINLIDKNQLHEFVSGIHKILRKDGIFVSRVFCLPQNINSLNSLEYFKNNFGLFKFGLMCSDFFIKDTCSENQILFNDVLSVFNNNFNREEFDTEDLKTIDIYYKSIKTIMFFSDYIIKKYFENLFSIKKYTVKDHGTFLSCFYVFEKK